MVAFYITLVFAVYVAVPCLGACVARRKGRFFGLYFAAGLLIGPIILTRRKGRPFGLYFAAGLLIGPIKQFGALLLPRR
jgi:hypothetical protein